MFFDSQKYICRKYIKTKKIFCVKIRIKRNCFMQFLSIRHITQKEHAKFVEQYT